MPIFHHHADVYSATGSARPLLSSQMGRKCSAAVEGDHVIDSQWP